MNAFVRTRHSFAIITKGNVTIHSTSEINEAHAHNLFNIRLRIINLRSFSGWKGKSSANCFLFYLMSRFLSVCAFVKLCMNPRNQEIETEMGAT